MLVKWVEGNMFLGIVAVSPSGSRTIVSQEHSVSDAYVDDLRGLTAEVHFDTNVATETTLHPQTLRFTSHGGSIYRPVNFARLLDFDSHGNLLYSELRNGARALMLLNASTGEAELMTFLGGAPPYLRYSPSGEAIVYVPQGKRQIILEQIVNHSSVILFDGENQCHARDPSFSQDGKEIVFAVYSEAVELEEFVVMDSTGGATARYDASFLLEPGNWAE